MNANGIANSGTDEANHFMQMAGPWMRPGYLLPVHDLEAGDGVRTDNAMAQFAVDFSNRINEVMGIRPAVYVNGNYAANILGAGDEPVVGTGCGGLSNIMGRPVAQSDELETIDVQNGNPKDSYTPIYGPWDDAGVTHPWSFWQYASTMKLNGNNLKQSNTDVNVANGGMDFLKDKLVPALWTTDNSGDWSTLANWNSGQTGAPGRVRVRWLASDR